MRTYIEYSSLSFWLYLARLTKRTFLDNREEDRFKKKLLTYSKLLIVQISCNSDQFMS